MVACLVTPLPLPATHLLRKRPLFDSIVHWPTFKTKTSRQLWPIPSALGQTLALPKKHCTELAELFTASGDSLSAAISYRPSGRGIHTTSRLKRISHACGSDSQSRKVGDTTSKPLTKKCLKHGHRTWTMQRSSDQSWFRIPQDAAEDYLPLRLSRREICFFVRRLSPIALQMIRRKTQKAAPNKPPCEHLHE